MPLRWSKPQRVCKSDCPNADSGKGLLNLAKKKSLTFVASESVHFVLADFVSKAATSAAIFGYSMRVTRARSRNVEMLPRLYQ